MTTAQMTGGNQIPKYLRQGESTEDIGLSLDTEIEIEIEIETFSAF